MGRKSRRKAEYRRAHQQGDLPPHWPAAGAMHPRSSPGDILWSALAALLLLTIGLFSLAQAWSAFVTLPQGAGWPATAGQVVSAKAVPLPSSRKTNDWAVQIAYSYRVDGRAFSGTRYRLHPAPEFPHAEAQEIAGRYSAGQTVQVFYNPRRPQESFLIHGHTRLGDYLALVAGPLFVLGGATIPAAALISWLRPPSVPPRRRSGA